MPAKILVVDDEPDIEPLIRQKFRKKMRRKEFQFSFACNGVDALEKLQADSDIDMVLTDINMPKMDGLALLMKLAADYPAIKTVILSAYGDMNNIRAAMNLGAFDFLTKPIDFQDLEIKRGRYGGISPKGEKTKRSTVSQTGQTNKSKKNKKKSDTRIFVGNSIATPSMTRVVMPRPQSLKNKTLQTKSTETLNLEDKTVPTDRIIEVPKNDGWKHYNKNQYVINGIKFRSTMKTNTFIHVLKNVFGAEEKEDGRIKFQGKIWDCSNEDIEKKKKMMFHCFGASKVLEPDSKTNTDNDEKTNDSGNIG